ncbi:MAG: hypothetical protein ACLVB4_07840 [Butyricicoccus sp.]
MTACYFSATDTAQLVSGTAADRYDRHHTAPEVKSFGGTGNVLLPRAARLL